MMLILVVQNWLIVAVFLVNTNSNGDNPCNAVDTKVFIAYALMAAYRGHDAPFCIKCLFIMLPIV